jgi:phage terminase large subunit-like protein
LRGRSCYSGLDLASTTDIAALVHVFPPEVEPEPYLVICRFFIPQDNMLARVKRDRVPYDVWCRQGFIEATPGNVIDYDFILAKLDEDAQKFDIQELAFDRWGATLIIQKIEEQGSTVAQFGQGFASMAAPTKELEKMVLGCSIAHGNNPVLSWMADNVVVRQDPAGNLKPDKEKSIEKIDGIVALIMALDRSVRVKIESVYETRGVLVL